MYLRVFVLNYKFIITAFGFQTIPSIYLFIKNYY